MNKLALLAWLAGAAAWASSIQVQNPYGDIAIRSAMGVEKPEVQVNVPSRPRLAEDVSITESPGVLRVRAQPADKARVDIEITLPYTGSVEATTKSGALRPSQGRV